MVEPFARSATMQIARKAPSLRVSTIMGRLRRRASEPSRLLRAGRLLILSRSDAKTGEAWTLPRFACSPPILVETRSAKDLIRGSLTRFALVNCENGGHGRAEVPGGATFFFAIIRFVRSGSFPAILMAMRASQSAKTLTDRTVYQFRVGFRVVPGHLKRVFL
jgi:hypothetical protein